jgi:hypothetical protein
MVASPSRPSAQPLPHRRRQSPIIRAHARYRSKTRTTNVADRSGNCLGLARFAQSKCVEIARVSIWAYRLRCCSDAAIQIPRALI